VGRSANPQSFSPLLLQIPQSPPLFFRLPTSPKTAALTAEHAKGSLRLTEKKFSHTPFELNQMGYVHFIVDCVFVQRKMGRIALEIIP
jgi:hypothetical protein